MVVLAFPLTCEKSLASLFLRARDARRSRRRGFIVLSPLVVFGTNAFTVTFTVTFAVAVTLVVIGGGGVQDGAGLQRS